MILYILCIASIKISTERVIYKIELLRPFIICNVRHTLMLPEYRCAINYHLASHMGYINFLTTSSTAKCHIISSSY